MSVQNRSAGKLVLARTGNTIIELQSLNDAANLAKTFAIDHEEVIEIVTYCGRCHDAPVFGQSPMQLCEDCLDWIFRR